MSFTPFPENPATDFSRVVMTNATVHKAYQAKASLEQTIIALAVEVGALREQYADLQLTAPKKLRLPDGRVFVYHCPDELIPEQAVSL